MLFFLGEYQIYFIECVENIRIFTSAHSDVFNSRDEIYLVFTKKSIFSLILYLRPPGGGGGSVLP